MEHQPAKSVWRSSVFRWWVLAGAVVLVIGILQSAENARRSRQRNLYASYINAWAQADKDTIQYLRQKQAALPREPALRAPLFSDFRAAVGEHFTPEPEFSIERGRVTFTDPVTGGQAEVWIYDGRADGVSPISRKHPNPARSFGWINLIRVLIYAGGYILWIAIFLMNLMERNLESRRINAHHLLIFAVSSTILAFAGIRGFRNWANFLQDNSPAWGYIMIPISLFLLFYQPRWLAVPAYPACKSCGYNLTGNISGICPECGKAIA